MKYVIVIFASLVLSGCPAAVCTHLETRCADDVAQLCDSRGRWQEVANCAEVEGDFPFVCRQDHEGDHVCLPGI